MKISFRQISLLVLFLPNLVFSQSLDGLIIDSKTSKKELAYLGGKLKKNWDSYQSDSDLEELILSGKKRSDMSNSDSSKFIWSFLNLKLHVQQENDFAIYQQGEILLKSGFPMNGTDSLEVSALYFNALISLKLYEQAIRFIPIYAPLKKNEDKEQSIRILLRKVWSDAGFFEKLIESSESEIAQLLNNGQFLKAREAMNKLGGHFYRSGDLINALEQWKKTLLFIEEINAKDQIEFQLIPIIQSNIGKIQLEKGNFKMAIPLIKSDLNSYSKMDHPDRIASLIALSDAFRMNNQLDSSSFYLLLSENLIVKNLKNESYRKFLVSQANFFLASRQPIRALKNLEAVKLAEDSIASISKHQQSLAMSVIMDLESTQRSTVEDRASADMNASIATSARTERNLAVLFGLLGLVFVALTLLGIYIQRKIQAEIEKQTQEIDEQKNTIEASLEHKQSLLQEMYFRVHKNLQTVSSLLGLQADEIEDHESKRSLEIGQQRIRAMGLIHEMLQTGDGMQDLELDRYLKKLISDLIGSEGHSIQTHFDLEEIHLKIDIAVPIGLIVNEVVTNSIKYAFAKGEGKLMVTLSKMQNGEVLLEILDNGPGYSDLTTKGNLGTKLIRLLTRQIEASNKRENRNGAYFSLQFHQVLPN